MGWLKDAWKQVEEAVQNVAEATVTVVTAPTQVIIDTLNGVPVGDAIVDAFAGQIGAGADVLEAAAIFEALAASAQQQVANDTLGPDAASVVADIYRITRPLDPNLGVAAARAIEEFIQTGRLEVLNPVAVLLATEILRCRNALLYLAQPISDEVRAAMPRPFQPLASAARVITTQNVPGDLNLPAIAIDHLRRASAVTLIDVIVFEDIPSIDTVDSKFFWAHELHHVKQYAEKGVIRFCAEYIGEELTGFEPYGTPPGNALEVEADYFACRYFPEAQPKYIDRCPIINRLVPTVPPPPPPPDAA